MQLQIVSNPNRKNPNELLTLFKNRRDKITAQIDGVNNEAIDRTGLRILKDKLSNSQAIKVY